MPLHSSAHGTDLHEALREKAPVRAASTATVALGVPGATLDGVALAVGDRILLKNQSASPENGIYVWSSASTALVRATDCLLASDFVYGFKLWVREGTTNGATHWVYSQSAVVVVGTTPVTFVGLGTGSGPTGATGAPGVNGLDGAPGVPGLITVSGAPPYICIQDQKANATPGGTFTSGAWRTRTLNTVVADSFSLAVLDRVLNRITLPAGTWRTTISAPGYFCGRHAIRLQNITAGLTTLNGTGEFANAISIATRSVISGTFGIRQSTVFEVQHQCSLTSNTNGLGVEAGTVFTVGGEVYTIAEFWLEAGPPPFLGRTPDLPARAKVRFFGQAEHSLDTTP